MLEQLRKSGASIFVYLIFGLLIIIFVINFAPNAGQGTGGAGCMGMTSGVIQVGSSKVNQTGYHIAYAANKYSGRYKVYAALEMLIRRELLADAASENGIRVTKDALEAELKKGYFFFAGYRIPDYQVDPAGGPAFVSEHSFFDDVDGEKFFNFGKFKGWVQTLNVSVGSYYDEQERSMQAALMSEMLRDSVQVSRDEAMADYLFGHNTVTYDVVTFKPTDYRDAMRLTDADVARFLAGHEADVKKKYADEERTYKATKPALELRMIKVDVAKAEPPPAPPTPPTPAPGAGSGSAAPAGAGSGSAAAEKKPEEKKPEEKKPDDKKVAAGDKKTDKTDKTDEKKLPTADEAKAKLEAAKTAITSGKQKFADAAKALSTDETTKYNGGYVGWKPVENAGLGDKAINDAVKGLKPGEMTAVVAGDNAVYLVQAEAKREGDLSYDQVKNEIAAEMARKVWSDEAAKRAALEAFKDAHAGNAKNLSDMFEKGIDEQEQQRRMQEMIEQQLQMQQGGGGEQGGALEVPPSKDQPASWTAADDQTPGGGSSPAGSAAPSSASAAPASTGSAAPASTGNAAPASTGSAAPASTGSAAPASTGSAAPAAGAGSGSAAPASGSAAPGTAAGTPAPAAAPIEASTDVLPQFGEISKPKVVTEGPVAREKEVPGLVGVKDATTALFDELTPGMLGKKVYETSEGNYALIQLGAKQDPKVADFDKIADREIARLRELRGRAAVESWLKSKCEALAKDGKIKPMAELVRETDDAGKPLPQVYRPCMSFH